MKNLQTLLLTAILGMIFQQFLPWYSIAVAGFIAAMITRPSWGGTALLMGFLGGAILWGGFSAYINTQNDGLMATRFGLTLGGLTPIMMILLTAMLGGVYAGLGTVCGYWARKSFGAA